MKMAEEELKQVKAMVRSVLLSCKEGVSSERFLVDYRDVTGEYLPFKKFGFRSVSDFVASIPDVINVRRQPGREDVYHAVADETTAHIQKLVSKQRSKKTKRPLKKTPMRKPYPPVSNFRPAGRGYNPPYRPQGSGPQGPPRHYGPSFQPHYAAIRRFGPQAPRAPAIRPPLLPNPPSPDEWHFSSRMSPLGVGEPFQNFQITVQNSGGKKFHPLGNRMIMRAMSDALYSSQGDNKSNIKYGHKFEIPPRFRKHHVMPKDEVAVFHSDGTDYIAKLNEYIWLKNLSPLKFETTQSGTGLFVSSVNIDTKIFGSIALYGTKEEAEYAAAKNAYIALDRIRDQSPSTSSSLSVPDADVKNWLTEILEPIPNGLWGTRIPVLFKEKFNEEAPANFLSHIGRWSDLIEIEKACGRELVKLVRAKPTVKWKEVVIPEPDLLEPSYSEPVTVYVSFALRLDNFFVQREDSNVDDINTILEAQCPSLPAPDYTLLKTGMCCAALYYEDSHWYRAEVIQLVDEGVSVQVTFVDYGNVETVPVSAVRQLPDDVTTIPAQAIPCALYGIIVTDAEKVSEPSPSLKEFSEVVKDSPVTALTVAYNTNGQCEVVLTKDDLLINLHLLKLGLVDTELDEWKAQLKESLDEEVVSDEPDTVILPDEKFLDLYVCFISPDLGVTVRIVGEDYSDKLDEFEKQLEECFKTAPTDDRSILPGQVCIASMDGLYQRVLVNSVTSNKAECYFTDHGDTDTVPLALLRPLASEVNASLPYQAVRCFLHGLEKVTDTVTALESLLELALGKTCVAEIVERDERLSVILFDTNEDADFNINTAVMQAIQAKEIQQNNKSPPNSESTKTSSVSPSSKTDSSTFTSNLPSVDRSWADGGQVLNRTCSTASADSWGTEEEAEALAASYLGSNSGSNWESSDIASPEAVTQNLDNSIAQRLAGLSVKSDTNTKSTSPQAGSTGRTSDTGSSQDSINSSGSQVKSKGLYTWGSPREPVKESGVLIPPKQVDIPAVGEFFDVRIMWVSDPTNFWCTPFQMVQKLENMMKDLNKYFSTNPERVKLTKKDVAVGSIYAGLMNDSWYRVIAKTILENEMISVYFPDYGSYTILETKDLQPLPEQFYALPLCAIKAKLHGVNPIDDPRPWSEAAKYKFLELTDGHDLVCLVCDINKSSGMISVKLVDTSSEEDILIDEVLLDMNYARSLES